MPRPGLTHVTILCAAGPAALAAGLRQAPDASCAPPAEERGLLGSRYHAAHPVVPLARIVAVLNGDMIGRNHPDSASLLGAQPPHRNSSDLVALALQANALTGRFVLDSLWDRPAHPEGWYFRSDHLPYARMNVPALMYSTNLHDDYHTSASTPTTHSCTRRSGSRRANRSGPSTPSANSRSASDRLAHSPRDRRRSRFSGRVDSGP